MKHGHGVSHAMWLREDKVPSSTGSGVISIRVEISMLDKLFFSEAEL